MTQTNTPQKTIIIGGVAGGASAAARLRRLNEQMEIIMLERGEYISYANCGLPYYIGGEIKDKSALTLQSPRGFHNRFHVDVRTQSQAIAINREQKTVRILRVETGEIYEESYDKLILSPGAEPVRLPIEGAKLPHVFTLRTIPDTYRIKEYVQSRQPKTAVVIGGGYIGIEMAENLHALGVAVTIAELADHVIAPLDYDMACEVHNHIKSKGVKLVLGSGVTEIRAQSVVLSDGSEVDAELVIAAVGVKPDTQLAKDAGLALGVRGTISVDKNMKTSDPDIYAVGDAVEVENYIGGGKAFIPLAGPANKQGRIAADHIMGFESGYKGTQGTAIVKVFDLTVATTGLNEKALAGTGVDFEKSFTYSASHASYYPGAVNMSVKLIFEKTGGKILGAQIVGFDGVDKRCDVIATAIRAGMTVWDLTELELAYAPPYSSAKDPVNMAGYVASNILEGKVRVIHWHELAGLDKNAVTLLDVRTPAEVENGTIDGFINIPLDDLRSRMGEIDKSKPVVVTCQIGLRGYYACRILSQNGFECSNLSGGYRLWKTIFGSPEKQTPLGVVTLMKDETQQPDGKKIVLDACGLSCPGPVMKLSQAIRDAEVGDQIEITTTDPAFASDVEAWCKRTGNEFISLSSSKGVATALVRKAGESREPAACSVDKDGKNIIVFSGDLDKAIASFIIANAAASMGRKVSMFFTFWGLNILRRREKVSVKKDLMSRMFGSMMPRGSQKLGLSKMNMGGMGSRMIRGVMSKKNISSLEELIESAKVNGVELVACTMSMDVMGITKEELIDGINYGGAASMLAHAEESDMSLFI